MVTNTKVGTPARSSSRQSVSVWACTPSVPLMTSTAQSSTRSVRSASAEKSTCPGVSSRVTLRPPNAVCACLAKIVMPLARSRLWVSRKLSLWSTRPGFFSFPERTSIASQRVVLPASTWARMPITVLSACLISGIVSAFAGRINYRLSRDDVM